MGHHSTKPSEILVLIVFLAIVAALFYYIPKALQPEPKDIYACSSDGDCLIVVGGCCGCNSGGNATAINKEYLDYWTSKMEDECGDVFCTAVMSGDWTCSATKRCIEGRCRLVGFM
ncbi:MAG: hypothetical protein ACP5E4_03790 [Candidatus Aenigmatarchaeota archaeon]